MRWIDFRDHGRVPGMQRTGSVLVLAVLCPLAAFAAGDKKEVGNLVIDGIPEIPKDTLERMGQYFNTRAARLVAWDADGKGMIVSTRFGETNQLHHVGAPGAYREQLTFAREPVSVGATD